jgi:glycosyltransferase involved in cell wall biosynthesis
MALKQNIIILASWLPQSSKSGGGGFILDHADALRIFPEFNVEVIDCTQKWSPIPQKFRALHKAWQIKRELQKKNLSPDIIHAHAAYPAGLIGLYLKETFHCPVVLTEHTGPIELLAPYFESSKSFFDHYSQYDAVITVSSFLKSQITNHNKTAPITVIGNVVHESFLNRPITNKVDQPSACFIGRLTEEKGIPDLLDALDAFEANPSISLESGISIQIAGVGPLATAIIARTKLYSKVKLQLVEKHLTRREIQSMLLEHSFLLLPSKVETFSLIAAEALALGRPVLGYNCGGPNDFITPQNGLLLEKRDPEKFALELFRFATDQEWKLDTERCTLRRQFIQVRYSAQSIASQVEQIYKDLPKRQVSPGV